MPNFMFIGILPNTVLPADIPVAIREKIHQQQVQFTPTIVLENIELIEHGYTTAEPNCWMIYAKWQQC